MTMAMVQQPPTGVVYNAASSGKTGKKRVRFSKQVVCFGIPNDDDKTVVETSDPANDCSDDVSSSSSSSSSSLWFTPDELRRIRRRTAKQADRIEAMQNDDDIQTRLLVRNTIGLETNRDRAQRKQRVRKAILSVLLAQEQMWDEDIPQDPEVLATVYAERSRSSARKAKTVGTDCAVQVQRYYHSYADEYLYEETTPSSSCSRHGANCPTVLVNNDRKWMNASAPSLLSSTSSRGRCTADCCGAPTLPKRTRSY